MEFSRSKESETNTWKQRIAQMQRDKEFELEALRSNLQEEISRIRESDSIQWRQKLEEIQKIYLAPQEA